MLKPLIILAVAFLPLVAASCNIDSAGVKTYSTSDGLVVTKVGVVATFRLGCSQDSPIPQLHAESEGRYLSVSTSTKNNEFREVSFVEDTNKSKSRWIEIKVYDDETYQKLLQARQSGSSESYFQPMKTISVSHHGVSGGPWIKMETVIVVALIAILGFANKLRLKIME